MKLRMILLLILAPVLLTACLLGGNEEDGAQSLVDRLEFNDDEYGCVTISGDVDLGSMPFFSSKASVLYKKQKLRTGADGNVLDSGDQVECNF